MKSIIILVLLSYGLVCFGANEQLGLGVSLGNPTGLNGKYWLNAEQAVDGGLGLSLGRKAQASMHSDFLLHKFDAFYFNDIHSLDLYYGLGGRMEFAEDIELGVRLPIGLAHKFKDQPADTFFEVAPIIDFIGRMGLELHLAFGGRFYF